jgi:putative ABC transport system permease protein
MSFPYLTSIQSGIHSLRANPLRTMLSTLGVIIGVASLVAILSIGDSLERFSREQIEQTTDLQTIQISSVTTDFVDGVRLKRENPVLLRQRDAAALTALLDDRADVGLIQTGSAWLTLEGDTARHAVLVSAVTSSMGKMGDAEIIAGRFLEDADTSAVPAHTVITSSLAAKLDDDPAALVGRRVRILDDSLLLVGVMGGPEGSRSSRMLVPFGLTSERLKMLADKAPVAIVRARRIEDVEELRVAIESWLESRFGSAEDLFSVATSQARVAQARRAMLVFKLALGAITGISLLVGGIGIMNVLLASVSERTREIGVRKAAGARYSDVLVQFLAESVSITGAGALVGVVVGVIGSFGVTAIIRMITEAPMKTTFTWWSILLAAAAALLVGLVFGTYPARKAARLSASDAMRYE